MVKNMTTEVIVIDEKSIDEQAIKKAGEIIKNGGLVAFPTETVYGLGGDGLNPRSSEKIYKAKGRPSDNPLIIHIAELSDLEKIAVQIPETAYVLARQFWPGPMTLILKKAECVPAETTGGLKTVAVRMPSHPVALDFIRAAGGFVAAPSANLSGKPSPTCAKYVIQDLSGRVEMIIDGGDVEIGLESTIIDLTEERPVILRPGYITREMLVEILEEVDIDKTLMSNQTGEKPKAPGMKYRHYAPKGELTIIEGDADAVVSYINEKTETAKQEGHKVGVISTDRTTGLYCADVVKSAGSRENEETIAKELYRILREFDDEEVTLIFSESFDMSGIGQAIMNRLLKAAGYKKITLNTHKED